LTVAIDVVLYLKPLQANGFPRQPPGVQEVFLVAVAGAYSRQKLEKQERRGFRSSATSESA
jgi:hypothetical protein